MDVREKLVELIHKARLSMWGKNGLSCELARNSYIADYLISHGVTVQEWISVKEKLPNDREWVLVWHTGYSTPKKAKHKDDCDPYLPIFILDGDKGLGGEVTHWMPLPKPPKGE